MIFGQNPDEPDWNDDFSSPADDALDSWGSAFAPEADDRWGWEEWGMVTLFRPEGHEPAYAYPLIVWLSSDTTPGVTLRDWFPDLSERNYIGAECSPQAGSPLALQIRNTVRDVSQIYQIHPRRVWIAGQGAAADVVLRELPALVPVVAGVIALHPTEPLDSIEPALTVAHRASLYLSLISPREDEAEQVSAAWRDAEGQCRCVLTVPDDSEERLAICRDLNVWLMEQVVAPASR